MGFGDWRHCTPQNPKHPVWEVWEVREESSGCRRVLADTVARMDMETATPSTKRTVGRPFTKKDPRIQAGPGRPPVPPEVREVRRRVVASLVDELKAASDLAVDRLVKIVSDPKTKDSDAVAAAGQILDRSWGRAVQAIDARVQFSDATVISAEDIRTAALRLAASTAEDVFG